MLHPKATGEEELTSTGQRNQALPQNPSTVTLVLSGQVLRPGFSLLDRWNETGMETWNPDEAHGLVSFYM